MVADDVVIAIMPFFHIYGMTVLLNAVLHARARLVIMPSFDLEEFLGNIQNHKCTVGFIAPPVAVALAKHPAVSNFDLSSLQTIMSGAAPLDAELGHAVADRIGCRVVQGYGMSELSPVSHITPFDGGQESMGSIAPLSSVGWTVSNSACKLVDPETGDEIECSRRRSQRGRRTVVQGPERDGRIPRQRKGHRGNDRRRRLAAHR